MPINRLVVEQLKQHMRETKMPEILNLFLQLEKASSKEKQVILSKLRAELNAVLIHDEYMPYHNAVYDALIAITEYKPIEDSKEIKEIERKVYKGVAVVSVSRHGEAEAGQILLPTFQQFLKDEVKSLKEEDKLTVTTSTGHKFNLKWLIHYYYYNNKYLNNLKDRPKTLLNPFTDKPFNIRDLIRIIAEADKHTIKIRDIEQIHWEVNIYHESLMNLAKSRIDLAATVLASPTLCSFLLPMQRSPDGISLHWEKPREFIQDCLLPILNAQPGYFSNLNSSLSKQLHEFMSRWLGSQTYVPRLFAMLGTSHNKSLHTIVLENFAKSLEQCEPTNNDKLKHIFLNFIAIKNQKYVCDLNGFFEDIKNLEHTGDRNNKLRTEFVQRLKAQAIAAYSSSDDKLYKDLTISLQAFKAREKLASKIDQMPDTSFLKRKANITIYESDSKSYEDILAEFNAEFKKLTEDTYKRFIEQSINCKQIFDKFKTMTQASLDDLDSYVMARSKCKNQLRQRVECAFSAHDELKNEIDSSCRDQEYRRFSVAIEKNSKDFNEKDWSKSCEDFQAREAIFMHCNKMIEEHKNLNGDNAFLLMRYASIGIYKQPDFKQVPDDLKKILNDFDKLTGLTADLSWMLQKYTPYAEEISDIQTIQSAIKHSYQSLLDGKTLSETEKDLYETIDNIRKSAENSHQTTSSLRFLAYIGMQPASPLVTLCKDLLKEFWRPDFIRAGMYRP